MENHILLEHNVMWLFSSRALRFRALRFSSQDKRLNIQGVQERYKTGIAIFRTQPSPGEEGGGEVHRLQGGGEEEGPGLEDSSSRAWVDCFHFPFYFTIFVFLLMTFHC